MRWVEKVAEEDISEALFAGILVALATFILGYALLST